MASCIGTWGVQKARVAQTKNRSEAVISRASATAQANSDAPATSSIKIRGIEHYAIIVRNTEKAVEFYQRVLGLPIRPGRPHDNLPYRGAWLALNESQTLHLMELDNPDPVSLEHRPEHGGRDRHVCIEIEGDIQSMVDQLEQFNVQYTRSKSGRQAVFFRDLDSNTVEVTAVQ